MCFAIGFIVGLATVEIGHIHPAAVRPYSNAGADADSSSPHRWYAGLTSAEAETVPASASVRSLGSGSVALS